MSTPQMSEEEFNNMMEQAGSLILDAAVGRLLLSLDDKAVEELQDYLEGVGENDDVLAHLKQTYPEFNSIISEEALALQNEGKEIAN